MSNLPHVGGRSCAEDREWGQGMSSVVLKSKKPSKSGGGTVSNVLFLPRALLDTAYISHLPRNHFVYR